LVGHISGITEWVAISGLYPSRGFADRSRRVSEVLWGLDGVGLCQKDIARKIRDGGGHFVLALKGNQSQIHEGVQETCADHLEYDFSRVPCRQHYTKERSHRRMEERYYYQMKVPAELPGRGDWFGLRTIGLVVNVTEHDGRTTDEVRYYLSSLPLGVKRFAEVVRSRWRVENSLHWTLDVTFDEDQSRVSKDHGAENLTLLRRMALSMLERYPRDKRSVRQRRFRARWNRSYLLKILAENDAS
jgi:predicted transposase YbfD/YdcC